MSNEFRQYIPVFISGAEEMSFDFDNTEELLNHQLFVKFFKMDGFKRFSKSDNRIMIELTSGSFHVIGFVKYPDLVDLPKFERG